MKLNQSDMEPTKKGLIRRRNSKRRSRKTFNEKHIKEETPAVAVSICQSPVGKRSDNPVSCFLDFESIDDNTDKVIVDSSSSCTTPKADKFRIPEIRTCPPAPKKRRPFSSNCSLKRTPLVFFAPPDLDNFLFSALHGIST